MTLDKYNLQQCQNLTSIQFLNMGIAFEPTRDTNSWRKFGHSTSWNLSISPLFTTKWEIVWEQIGTSNIKSLSILVFSLFRGMNLVTVKSENFDRNLYIKYDNNHLSQNNIHAFISRIISQNNTQLHFNSVLTKDLMQRRHWLELHKLHICQIKGEKIRKQFGQKK